MECPQAGWIIIFAITLINIQLVAADYEEVDSIELALTQLEKIDLFDIEFQNARFKNAKHYILCKSVDQQIGLWSNGCNIPFEDSWIKVDGQEITITDNVNRELIRFSKERGNQWYWASEALMPCFRSQNTPVNRCIMSHHHKVFEATLDRFLRETLSPDNTTVSVNSNTQKDNADVMTTEIVVTVVLVTSIVIAVIGGYCLHIIKSNLNRNETHQITNV